MRGHKLIITIGISAGLLLGIATLSHAQDFEGIIHYEVSAMGQQGTNTMPYMIKGNKGRIEMSKNGQIQAAMLLFPNESRMVILMVAMNGYMEMKTQSPGSNSDSQSDIEAELTGETKTIAGRECEVLRTEAANNVVEACMAKGLGPFMMPQNPMGKSKTPAWARELFNQNAMPLEVVEIRNGNRSVQMKATKIEEKSLSDDLFTIPDGYRDMSGMMNRSQN
ncbi:MAG: DUF4412 domain-containing protein [Fodinibius sp.]|nr:DUF4412 domain-containing protein [Fodinibius sp.]